ncbi:glycosyl hydrolase [Aspergillus pseudoustus]|uniref:Glycosyl hydrolase n=1 Tax=Aspergillus pseudoustus TaxID=1810923 RepID=A0ABR4IZU1_9EURO
MKMIYPTRWFSGALLLASCSRAAFEIVPGATWTATNTGEHIQAHGFGIIEENGIYYMIGEEKTDGALFQAVNCYSSRDLLEWSFEGRLLTRDDDSDGDLGPNRIIERPKVIKNDQTGKYVLWLHVDSTDYKDARTGVAVGDSVCGEYEYQGSFRPLDKQSRDIGLFKDGDGKGYLLSEDREYGTRIMKLTDDYLGVEEITFGWTDFVESPALVKRGDTYYIFGSHLTGWNANDNVYSTATSLSGPWSAWSNFAPAGTNTYTSQTNYILPLGSGAIYMGDRWVSQNLAASTYIWLPLSIDGTSVSMEWYDSWSVDVAAGSWSPGASAIAELEGESDGVLSGGARVVSCSQCSGDSAAGYIGGDTSDGAVTFEVEVDAAAAGPVTLVVRYVNGDTAQRFAAVEVNGHAQTVAFLSTALLGDTAGSSVVHVKLEAGKNVVKISGASGWGPDVDVLVV